MNSESYLDDMMPPINSKPEELMSLAELKSKQRVAEIKYGIAMAKLGKLIVSVASCNYAQYETIAVTKEKKINAEQELAKVQQEKNRLENLVELQTAGGRETQTIQKAA